MIEDVVESQLRRQAFLCALSDVSFFAQLAPYLEALAEDPRVAAVLDDLLLEAQKHLEVYTAHEKGTVRQLLELRTELVSLAPDLDDSTAKYDPNDALEEQAYSYSLAKFDEFLRKPVTVHFPVRADHCEDLSTTRIALDILAPKLRDSRLSELSRRAANIRREHEHAFQTFLLRGRTAAGFSLLRLARVRDELLPPPIRIEQGADRWETLLRFMPEMFGVGSHVRRALFLVHRKKDEDDEVAAARGQFQLEAQRLHEEVLQRLYRRRSYRVLVDRFKLRCESYDQERLSGLARRGARENPLNAEAARFLFDNGLNPLIGPQVGGLRPDVLPAGNWSFYLESKQYGDSKGRGTIRKASFQVWDTAGVLRSLGLREVFLLVFRLGGPLYVLPSDGVRAEGITLIPVLIDVAPPEQRASRQKHKPILITAEELLPQTTTRRQKGGGKS